MTDLENNINHYMSIKGIKSYIHLLREIALKLGIDKTKTIDFAYKEKANFSKMLKGKRHIKYDFIVPLETILGVPLAKILNPFAYMLPIDKENVPYDKGFRYYAYKDDIKLYEKELDTLLTKSEESPLSQMDEFGKTFLDYVVEYNSINGVRFLRDKYHLKLRMWNNLFETEPKGMFWVHDKGIDLARMIANMGDTNLFNDIYDSYYVASVGRTYHSDIIFAQDEYLEIMLSYKNLFESIFQPIVYKRETSHIEKRKYQIDTVSFCSINPIINNCLKYALNHIDKFKKQAIKILEFGIEHNREVIDHLHIDHSCLLVDEVGALHEIGHLDRPGLIDIVVFCDNLTNDKEIDTLINRLPTFDKLF